MATETERKFLVEGDYRADVTESSRIVQGYLSSVAERTVRVRIRGERGYLTIKGAGNASGLSRYEWEREIPLAEAEELLALCEPGVIEKVRHLVPVGDHVYEVDEFHGDNAGLVVAEIELAGESEAFEKPAWLGREVTGEVGYYNAMLMRRPYSTW
jgi:CYTH domain-containing protein